MRSLALLLLAACGEVAVPISVPTPSTEAPSQDAPAGLPAEGQGAWWSSVSSRMAHEQLQLQQVDGALRLVSPSTHLDVTLAADGGATLAPRPGAEAEAPFTAPTLRTVAVGRGGTVAALPVGALQPGACAPGDVRQDVHGDCLRRAELVQGAVTSWWANTDTGLTQGWTVAEAPGAGALELQVHVAGLPVQVADGGQRIQLGAPGAGVEGTQLAAWDATGRALAVHAEARGEGFALVVEAEGAAFPVTVDPSWVPWAWTVEGDQMSAFFGYAVATGDVNGDGYDDMVVGAYGFDNGESNEGRVFVYLGSAGALASTPAATWESNQVGAAFGHAVATGDVNGDGYADVVVGARLFDGGVTDEGRVYVYLGGTGALATTPAVTWECDQTLAFFGQAVATGDLNGDDFADVLVGAITYSNGQSGEGGLFVYLGASGTLPSSPAVVWESNQAAARMGAAVATGDVNGDGIADAVVGATAFDNGHTNEGRVSLYLGTSGTLPTTPAMTWELDQTDAGLGQAVATGDVNGDGYDDVVAGAGGYANGQTWEGAALVYVGGAGTLASSPAATWEGDQGNGYMGWSIATGDVNGDGRADILAGAYQFDNGQINEARLSLFLGSTGTLPATPDVIMEADQSGALFGFALATGDIDGDGYDDALVGAHSFDNEVTDEGRVFVYLGSAGALSSMPSATWEIDQIYADFGFAVATGDLSGDGYADVVVGAPRFDNGESNEGRVFVYPGSASTLATTPLAIWESDQANAQLGWSVATGDVNGDGYDDVVTGASGFDNGQTNEGQVQVYLGGAAPLATAPAAAWESDQANALLGHMVATGDVNGDGYADVVAAAPYYDSGQTDEGSVFVYLGGSGTLAATQAVLWEGNQAQSTFGDAMATGDVNGDGYTDVVVGARNFDNGQSNEGGAFLFLGSGSALSTTPVRTWESDNMNSTFGAGVAMGDVNGDGFADAVVSAWLFDGGFSDEGRVYVYLGTSGTLPTTAATSWEGELGGASLGLALAAADVDGDGRAGVFAVGLRPMAGEEVNVVGFEPASGLPGPTATWAADFGTSTSYTDGLPLASGDVNGDGYDDLVVGSGSCPTVANSGCIYLYYGGPLGLSLTPPVTDADNDGLTGATDCDDNNAAIGAASLHYTDGDGDGYGLTSSAATVCPASGLVTVGGDCNDAAAAVKPGAVEVAGDGVDQDCDGGELCYANADGDAYRTVATVVSADPDCTDPGEAVGTLPAGDCNDALAAVNPGAVEAVANGVDDDCDGVALCWANLDGDGYRAATTVASGDADCTDAGEADGALPAGDCDDGRATVYPGALEVVASGRDEDCDGAELCYVDGDADGWRAFGGVSAPSVDADCDDVGEALASTPVGDCDDANLARNPGAIDLPGDGIDQDCDGADDIGTDPCDGGGGLLASTLALGDTDLGFVPERSGDDLGRAVAVGDFDGDGVADVAVGAAKAALGASGGGAVYVFFGPLAPGAPLNVTSADAVLVGSTPGGRAGFSLAVAGDVDGGGQVDLVVGSLPTTTSLPGEAWLVLGETLDGGGTIDLDTEADAHFTGLVAGDETGAAVAGAGDLDGDGFDDLAIGSPKAASGGFKRGAVHVFLGPVTGERSVSTADARVSDTVDKAWFGSSLASLGSVDGVAGPELVVGAPNDGSAGSAAGSVYVFSGLEVTSGAVLASTAYQRFVGATSARVGASVAAAGDADGDGSEDLWVGATHAGGFQRGIVYLVGGDTLPGTTTVQSVSDFRFLGQQANDLVGSSLAGGADLDADGHVDLVVGGERAVGEVNGAGAAWVLYGPFTDGSRTTFDAAGKVVGRAFQDLLGASVAAGDVNADGFADVFVGAPRSGERLAGGGTVRMLLGGDDAGDFTTYFRDADGDGYGDALVTLGGCDLPGGYVANDDDCDDGSPLTNPTAFEDCVGPDRNCDGLIGAVDADNDGYLRCGVGGDCNDTNAAVNPGAPDLCGTGVDEDCNGEVDGETADDALFYFQDLDGDGYGSPVGALASCMPSDLGVPLVLVGGDCDDFVITTNPAGTEVCGGADEDCDGLADEADAMDAPVWYRDADADTFGDPFRTVRACAAPSLIEGGLYVHYVANAGDCEDTLASVNPGATETCDGLDNDCDGAYALSGTVDSSTRDVETLLGTQTGLRLGSAQSLILGDQDLDGDDELAFALPGATGMAVGSGLVFVRRSEGALGDRRFDPARPTEWDTLIEGDRASAGLGTAMVSADLNGDGVADLVVGAPGARVPGVDQGAVYVFYGPIAADRFRMSAAPLVLRGEAAGDKAGIAIDARDIDGDGFDDLVVGAPGAAGGLGKAYVVYGRAGFTGSFALASGGAFVGTRAAGQAGGAVAFAGDLDDDGYDDVVIGAASGPDLSRGAAHLVYGKASRFTGALTASSTLTGSSQGERFATSVAGLGDVDGDGYSDLAFGTRTNLAWLVRGRAARFVDGNVRTVAAVRFLGTFGASAGRRVEAIGDLDGDGLDDLGISAADDDARGRDAGAAYVVYGRDRFTDVVPAGGDAQLDALSPELQVLPGGVIVRADLLGRLEGAKITGTLAGDGFGAQLAGGGDLDGDGLFDLVVGAPRADLAGAVDAGRIHVYRGGSSGLDLDVTDGSTVTLYWDRDQDGYTDGTPGFAVCPTRVPVGPTGGTVTSTTQSTGVDCLDTSGTAFPGAAETDADGEDSNCDGFDDLEVDGDFDGATSTEDCDDADATVGAPGLSLLDSIEPGSISTWTEALSPDNPVVTYSEVVSPFDGSTALHQDVFGNTVSWCNVETLTKVFPVDAYAVDGSYVEFDFACTSNQTPYNRPGVCIRVTDTLGASASQCRSLDACQGWALAKFPDLLAGTDRTHRAPLPSTGAGRRIASVQVQLEGYACEGVNTVTLDNIHLDGACP